jgi:Beta/Gamma crystallin
MTTITLYRDPNLQGPSLTLQVSDDDLRRDFLAPIGNFNTQTSSIPKFLAPIGNWDDQTSSIAISGGNATFYRDTNFGGSAVTLGPGLYPSVENVGIPNDSISSVFVA